MGGEMACQVARIVLRPMDETRLAATQECQPDAVESRGHHTSIVAQPALAIEHRKMEPRMVRLEAGGPDHASNALPGEVENQVR